MGWLASNTLAKSAGRYAMLAVFPLHGSERHSFGLIMSKNSRVHHERGFTMKRGYALKVVKEGNYVWLPDGKVRDATPEEVFEVMQLTAEERRKRERDVDTLADAELHGFHRTPRASMEHRLIRAAYGFASGQLGY